MLKATEFTTLSSCQNKLIGKGGSGKLKFIGPTTCDGHAEIAQELELSLSLERQQVLVDM